MVCFRTPPRLTAYWFATTRSTRGANRSTQA
jgi:hypothetical protein